MKRFPSLALAMATVAGFAVMADRSDACGRYGPPPMSQTMFAALSDDARVSSAAIEKMRQQGSKAVAEVQSQQFWLPMTIRRLDYQIAHFEKLVATGEENLSKGESAKRKLRLTQLRLERAKAQLKSRQLEVLLKRLQWAIARSTVVT